jgi:hypothetical protein
VIELVAHGLLSFEGSVGELSIVTLNVGLAGRIGHWLVFLHFDRTHLK